MDSVGGNGCYFCWELVRFSYDMDRTSQTSLHGPYLCAVCPGKERGGGQEAVEVGRGWAENNVSFGGSFSFPFPHWETGKTAHK